MATLRIKEAWPGGRRQVSIAFDDTDTDTGTDTGCTGTAGRSVRRSATTRFGFTVAHANQERLCWHLGNRVEHPTNPTDPANPTNPDSAAVAAELFGTVSTPRRSG